MFDKLGLSLDFIVRRVPAYFATIPIAILGFGHVYLERPVNPVIMYDLAILVGLLFAYPRIKLSDEEQSYKLTKNLVSYFLLITLVIPGSLFEFFGYGVVNTDIFSILTVITASVFGLSKIDISRSSLMAVATNAADIKQNYNNRKELSKLNTAPIAPIIETQEGFPNDLEEVKTTYKPTTLKDAAILFIGTTEIKGSKHNKVIIQFGKWADINWYDKDEIPWCAVFVNAMLYLIGKTGTKSALAKSFLTIGTKVTLEEVKKDPTNVVAIYHRGKTSKDISGHVQIVTKVNNDNTIEFVTGNVSDTVKTIIENLDKMLNEKLSDGTKKFIEFRRI